MEIMTLDSYKLTRLYNDYREPLVTVARLYVRDRMVAEDIVADSFVKLYHALPSLPEDTRVEAYLTTIVKNQCLNYLKSVKVHKAVEGDMKDHQQRLVDEGIRGLSALEPESLFASEVQRIVSETLGKMENLTQRVFAESRYSGKTYNEIADTLGIPPRKVHTEIEKALKLLRKALSDYLPAWLLTLYLEHIIK